MARQRTEKQIAARSRRRQQAAARFRGFEPLSRTLDDPVRAAGSRSPLSTEVQGYARTLGGFSGAAIAEMRARQQGAERVLGGELQRIRRDPLWGTARTLALKKARDPGINPQLLARIRGRLAARTTAETAGASRNVVAQLARGNIGGSAAVNALQLARNRGAIARNVGALGIDQFAAEQERQGSSQAISQIMNLLQTQYGMTQAAASRYASTMLQYDPLDLLQRQQRFVSPVGAVAEGLALQRGTR